MTPIRFDMYWMTDNPAADAGVLLVADRGDDEVTGHAVACYVCRGDHDGGKAAFMSKALRP